MFYRAGGLEGTGATAPQSPPPTAPWAPRDVLHAGVAAASATELAPHSRVPTRHKRRDTWFYERQTETHTLSAQRV